MAVAVEKKRRTYNQRTLQQGRTREAGTWLGISELKVDGREGHPVRNHFDLQPGRGRYIPRDHIERGLRWITDINQESGSHFQDIRQKLWVVCRMQRKLSFTETSSTKQPLKRRNANIQQNKAHGPRVKGALLWYR